MTALWTVVSILALYARRDWYVSLCGLIVLMTVIEHPDAPKTMFGIQGLNFWNLLLAVVVVAWYSARKREGLTWDMPRGVTVLLLMYLAVVCVSFARMLVNRTAYLDDMNTLTLISEYFVNTLKWVVPGLLLFDGCRTRKRFYLAVGSLLAVYVLLALYVIKWMPLGLLTSGDELQRRAVKILVNEIGFHRVTMSMMLAGASWAVFSARVLFKPLWQRVAIMGVAGAIVLAQALTGGRMGYVTWAVIGAVLLAIRGRGFLLVAPVVAGAILLTVPAVSQRLLEGFDPSTSVYLQQRLQDGVALGNAGPDVDTITAGRTLIWPYVVRRIAESPVVGYGMLAMRRTGITYFLATRLGEGFDHPHNAYLELLFDSGIIGVLAVMPFYAFVLWCALRLYADSRSPIFMATGGITAALVLALLVASFGSQTFYPREAAVMMWCAIGVLLRVWVERRRAAGQVSLSRPAADPPRRIAWPGAESAPPAAARVATGSAAPSIAMSDLDVDQRLWRTA